MSRSDRMPSMRPWLMTSTAPILRSAKNLDRGRELGVRLDAQDLMAFGIENCTYRHCRLPESVRALNELDLFTESSINSSAPASFRARAASAAVVHRSKLWLASQLARMMNEIALRRKRRSDAVRLRPAMTHPQHAALPAAPDRTAKTTSGRREIRRYAPARRRWRHPRRSQSIRRRR